MVIFITPQIIAQKKIYLYVLFLFKVEAQFKCQTCEKEFNYKSNLNAHIRSHTGKNLGY